MVDGGKFFHRQQLSPLRFILHRDLNEITDLGGKAIRPSDFPLLGYPIAAQVLDALKDSAPFFEGLALHGLKRVLVGLDTAAGNAPAPAIYVTHQNFVALPGKD